MKKILLYKNYIKENINYEDIEEWMTGDCIPFTVALKEIFPSYKIGVLLNNFEIEENDELLFMNDFVHAFCYTEIIDKTNKRKDIIIDAEGKKSVKEMLDYFWDIDPEIEWDIPNSKYLIDNYSGKEFYSSETYDYDEEEYQKAKNWIMKNKEKYSV